MYAVPFKFKICSTGKTRQFYRILTILLHNHAQNEEIRSFCPNAPAFRELPKFYKRADSTAHGPAELVDQSSLGYDRNQDHGAIRENMPEFEEEFPDFDKIGGVLLDLCQELGASRKIRGRTSIGQAVPKDGWHVPWTTSEQGAWRLVINASDQLRTFTYRFEQEENEYEPWKALMIELL